MTYTDKDYNADVNNTSASFFEKFFSTKLIQKGKILRNQAIRDMKYSKINFSEAQPKLAQGRQLITQGKWVSFGGNAITGISMIADITSQFSKTRDKLFSWSSTFLNTGLSLKTYSVVYATALSSGVGTIPAILAGTAAGAFMYGASKYGLNKAYENKDSIINKFKTNWQNYYNQPTDFKSLNIEKQLSLKNPTVSGISGGADNSLTPMQIKYPTIKINPSTSSWLGKLGDALSAVGKLAGAVAGATGGKINATKSVSGIVIPHYSDYTDQIIVPQFNDPAIHHTGGKISGKDEVMAILRGGETVRTEAQERELQEEKYKELMNFIGPMLQEKEQKPKTIAEAYDPNNKVPVLLNKTTQDEELIISIIAQAWKSNRLGFRNVLRYE